MNHNQQINYADDGTCAYNAKEWITEHRSGQIKFKTMRTKHAEHPIEKIGKKLRSMMWPDKK